MFSLFYVGLIRFIFRLKYIPVAAGRWSIRLVDSATLDGFVSQLTLIARGWGGRVVRSKRGFGLPGS